MSGSNGASATRLRLLSRDEIVGAQDLAREILPMPEWGEDAGVMVQALDVNRRLAYYEYILVKGTDPTTGTRTFEPRDDVPVNSVLAALGIIDANGEPVFTLADLELLGSKDPAPLARIGDAVQRLSKMGRYAETQASAPLAQNGVSPTASPVISG